MFYIRISVLLLCSLMVTGKVVASTLNDLKFAELPGGRIEVRATFSDSPVTPKGYSIEQPARIVLDFEGVDSNLEEKKFPLSFGNAKSAVVLSSSGRTRFIINLSSPSTYTTSVDGNTLVAVIEGATRAETFTRQQASEETRQTFTDKVDRSITEVDFRRTAEGAGTVLLTLSEPKVAVDIEQGSSGLVVNFVDTQLPAELRRRLDVIDFATPVKIIESVVVGSNTQISIDVNGDYDYLAYQTDNQYVITIKSLTPEQLAEKKERFKYVGEKLSLNFQDIKVRAVLEIIADVTGLNLVASDTVQGNITLRLENVPWDQALDLVLKSKSLDKRQVGNVLLVAPASEIAERERQEIQTRKQLQELAPLRTEFIRVRYAKAKDIFSLFEGGGSGDGSNDGDDSQSKSTAGILSSRGSAIVDERTNSIILTETEEKIADFKELVDRLDIPVRQVMIEARIVIANTDITKELGVRWGGISTSNTRNSGQGIGQLGGSIESFEGTGPGPIGFFNGVRETNLNGDDLVVDLGTTNPPAGSFALSYLSNKVFLNLELSALESSGYAEIVSQPKVITGDAQPAKIVSGQQIAFTSSDGDSVSTIFKDAFLSLEVTPQITPDNRVIMELKVNQDSVGALTDVGPTINVTELTTKALVGDGQTIVLGGVFTQTQSNRETKVPLLGDIPFLGRLFRNNQKVDDKQELLIFITPRILSDSLID